MITAYVVRLILKYAKCLSLIIPRAFSATKKCRQMLSICDTSSYALTQNKLRAKYKMSHKNATIITKKNNFFKRVFSLLQILNFITFSFYHFKCNQKRDLESLTESLFQRALGAEVSSQNGRRQPRDSARLWRLLISHRPGLLCKQRVFQSSEGRGWFFFYRDERSTGHSRVLPWAMQVLQCRPLSARVRDLMLVSRGGACETSWGDIARSTKVRLSKKTSVHTQVLPDPDRPQSVPEDTGQGGGQSSTKP